MKVDLTKTHKAYYTAKNKPELVDIEAAQYLSISGMGDPSGEDFLAHIQALYSTAYTMKFAFKAMDKDYVVAKLEGQWWFDEEKYKGATIDNSSTLVPRSDWEYRLLIRLPEYVGEADIATAVAKARAKKDLQYLDEVTFITIPAHKAVQMMHVGPFSEEPATLKVMGQFMEANKLGRGGVHREIYLTDFNKTAPEKLRTILREPVVAL